MKDPDRFQSQAKINSVRLNSPMNTGLFHHTVNITPKCQKRLIFAYKCKQPWKLACTRGSSEESTFWVLSPGDDFPQAGMSLLLANATRIRGGHVKTHCFQSIVHVWDATSLQGSMHRINRSRLALVFTLTNHRPRQTPERPRLANSSFGQYLFWPIFAVNRKQQKQKKKFVKCQDNR